MKEFIENLISRLEEISVENTCSDCPYKAKCDEIQEHINDETTDLCGATIKALSIEIVNQLAEEYINCSTDTSTNTSSGWIPCSERLPENYGTYLCCDKYGNFILGYPIARVSSNNFYVETECEIMNDCIAWMPLPPAYVPKEGRE